MAVQTEEAEEDAAALATGSPSDGGGEPGAKRVKTDAEGNGAASSSAAPAKPVSANLKLVQKILGLTDPFEAAVTSVHHFWTVIFKLRSRSLNLDLMAAKTL